MIPFLENDDNTRALMGSNMQKSGCSAAYDRRKPDSRNRYGIHAQQWTAALPFSASEDGIVESR